MNVITKEAWLSEGEKLFGSDVTKWKFICPICKTSQSTEDLINVGVEKKDIDGLIGFSCIGRFTHEKGCDWTLGGLFQCHTLEITDGERIYKRFEFDTSIPKECEQE